MPQTEQEPSSLEDIYKWIITKLEEPSLNEDIGEVVMELNYLKQEAFPFPQTMDSAAIAGCIFDKLLAGIKIKKSSSSTLEEEAPLSNAVMRKLLLLEHEEKLKEFWPEESDRSILRTTADEVARSLLKEPTIQERLAALGEKKKLDLAFSLLLFNGIIPTDPDTYPDALLTYCLKISTKPMPQALFFEMLSRGATDRLLLEREDISDVAAVQFIKIFHFFKLHISQLGELEFFSLVLHLMNPLNGQPFGLKQALEFIKKDLFKEHFLPHLREGDRGFIAALNRIGSDLKASFLDFERIAKEGESGAALYFLAQIILYNNSEGERNYFESSQLQELVLMFVSCPLVREYIASAYSKNTLKVAQEIVKETRDNWDNSASIKRLSEELFIQNRKFPLVTILNALAENKFPPELGDHAAIMENIFNVIMKGVQNNDPSFNEVMRNLLLAEHDRQKAMDAITLYLIDNQTIQNKLRSMGKEKKEVAFKILCNTANFHQLKDKEELLNYCLQGPNPLPQATLLKKIVSGSANLENLMQEDTRDTSTLQFIKIIDLFKLGKGSVSENEMFAVLLPLMNPLEGQPFGLKQILNFIQGNQFKLYCAPIISEGDKEFIFSLNRMDQELIPSFENIRTLAKGGTSRSALYFFAQMMLQHYHQGQKNYFETNELRDLALLFLEKPSIRKHFALTYSEEHVAVAQNVVEKMAGDGGCTVHFAHFNESLFKGVQEVQVVEETEVEETEVEETEVEETEVEETEVEETEVEETQVEETQVEEIQVEETQVEETQVEETQVEETEAEETEAEETEAEETEEQIQSSDNNELQKLKDLLKTTIQTYSSYNKEYCFFSIIHRHGKAGRDRATVLERKMGQINTLKEFHTELIDYIETAPGNKHPHSFKTYLLATFLPSDQKTSLNETSHHFDKQLEVLKQTWGVESEQLKGLSCT